MPCVLAMAICMYSLNELLRLRLYKRESNFLPNGGKHFTTQCLVKAF